MTLGLDSKDSTVQEGGNYCMRVGMYSMSSYVKVMGGNVTSTRAERRICMVSPLLGLLSALFGKKA